MKSPAFNRIGIYLFVVVLATLSSVSVCAQTKRPTNPAAKSAAATAPSTNGKAIGSKNAPITIEVFEDFECPACRNFYETSLQQVINNYVDTGKVYLIHRDFPLEMHPYARQAARFANAAAGLGQFQAVEQALFDTQNQWSQNGNIDEAMAPSFSPAQLKKIHDYESLHINEINASIERDRTMGIQRNVNQTPTIYVTSHGKMEALPGGGVDYKLLQQYLDFLLRQ
ncbi:MAG: DsbA family protein [Acidobacteriia bacterium]|nr:DsbA family protein [Terriglobia bacterium]